MLLGWVIYDDPASLLWCGALIAVGIALFLIEYAFGSPDRPSGVRRGDPSVL